MRFVDFLAGAGQQLWQVMPLGPTGYGDSPYQCFSAFAGNPLLISLDQLVAEGLLARRRLDRRASLPRRAGRLRRGDPLQAGAAASARSSASSARPRAEQRDAFADFRAAQPRLARRLRAVHGAQGGRTAARTGTPGNAETARRGSQQALARLGAPAERRRSSFTPTCSSCSSASGRASSSYANERGIQIIGDIPIFVAYDSADVWANRELFQLDEQGTPTVVAGVPPDYFSATGQLWGNPLYRWDALARRRLRLVDRALPHDARRWSTSCGSITSAASRPTGRCRPARRPPINGRWVPGPGAALFEAVRRALGDAADHRRGPGR